MLFRSGPGFMRENTRLPGRSRGAGEINKDGDRGDLGGVHGRIIMHAGEYVKDAHPLDRDTDRALACLHGRPVVAGCRSPESRETRSSLMPLALVIVLLSLLLTVLLGEQGVRGVPTRAT